MPLGEVVKNLAGCVFGPSRQSCASKISGYKGARLDHATSIKVVLWLRQKMEGVLDGCF